MAVNYALAEVVSLHRKATGLSRQELAMLAGVGKTVLYDIEHGKESVRFDNVLKVLRTLNIDLCYDSPLLRELRNA